MVENSAYALVKMSNLHLLEQVTMFYDGREPIGNSIWNGCYGEASCYRAISFPKWPFNRKEVMYRFSQLVVSDLNQNSY
jgi:hypothetical protein